ncbi:hypothetical protein [Pseudomonas sp. ICMP 561]|uniref:hypothetical protein n=1 Tax=Pseudomonas sp. ICMP 561 TaxID=1718918 RepID=UPI000C071D06|nr:hypothetical protein [Pseudomonas sp. ICMP 561]PHN27527.1 hypothetical protein AO242_27830 [Pseudomonas sp. ICMP 561]
MATIINELSFRATVRLYHKNRTAYFDFSKITSSLGSSDAAAIPDYDLQAMARQVYFQGTEEQRYLSATTMPRGGTAATPRQQFWFICRQFDDGHTSYQIKAQHDMFIDFKGLFNDLVTEKRSQYSSLTMSQQSIDYYVAPSGSSSVEWKILCDGRALTSSVLKTGVMDNMSIIAPNGNTVGINNSVTFGQDWWAYVSCCKLKEPLISDQKVIVPLTLDILETNIGDPVA